MTTDWEAKYDDLMERATAHVEGYSRHLRETIVREKQLQPLVIRETVAAAGYSPYQGGGARMAAHLIQQFAKGQIRLPVTVEDVFGLAEALRYLPDWAPFSEDM